MNNFYFACSQREQVTPNSVKPHLSGMERVELWRSGFLNNKHPAIHFPGVEVSLLPKLLPQKTSPPPLCVLWWGCHSREHSPLASEEACDPDRTNHSQHPPRYSAKSISKHVTQAGPASSRLVLWTDTGRKRVSSLLCPKDPATQTWSKNNRVLRNSI